MHKNQQQQQSPVSRRAVVGAVGGVTLTGLVAGIGGRRVAAQADPNAGIVGAWSITATVTSAGGRPPELFFGTFFADGNYVQSASNPGASTGHGRWQQTGDRHYALMVQIIIFGATPTDAPLRLTVRPQAELDAGGTGFSGPFQYEVALPSGMVVDQGEGTAKGTRMTL